MEIADKVEVFINDLAVASQYAKLYSPAHKKFEQSIDKTYKDAQDILQEIKVLIIGIIGDDFVFENEIFFEFSMTSTAQLLIKLFRDKGIEKIIFKPFLGRSELRTFIILLTDIHEINMNIGKMDYLGIENIVIDKITQPVSSLEEEKKDERAKFSIYENYLNKVTEYSDAVLNNQAIDSLPIKLYIISIMDNLLRLQRLLGLTAVKIRPSTPIVHTTNVSILALLFCLRMGFEKNEVIETNISALFHDIGRIYIYKKMGEAINTKSHSEKGAEILIKYINTLGLLPVLVAFEHHLRYDLNGYPRLQSKYKPHIASAIVSICDVYDSFSQRRSHKYDYSPDIIYKQMMQGKGNAFDPYLLEIFFRIIGIWPVGTIVMLNDGRVGVVCEENEDDIARPKVEITDYSTRKTIDLKNNEELKIERALNPFTEGNVYLDLI